jgi:hypothetical protein
MSGKKKHRSTNDYLNYLKGEGSGQERHAFERGLEADPFEQEAMDGLETLSAKEAEEDLLALHNSLRKRLSRRRRVAFYSVAATVASLLIVGTVFLKVHDFNPRAEEEKLYPEKSFEDLVPEKSEPVAASPEEVLDATVEVQDADKGLVFESEDLPAESRDIAQIQAIQEPEKKLEVSRMAAPMEAEEIQTDEMQAEEITYMEAEPVARPDDVQEARSGRKFQRAKKAQGVIPAEQKQAAPGEVFSQQDLEQMLTGKVTGIVISAEDQGPIPGAVIVNRDVNSGVYTDLEGRFGLPVQENTNTTLVASYIGMKTQEYEVENGAHLELVMQPDAATLDEVVVVGHVAEREVQPTGSAFELYQAEEDKGDSYRVPEPSIGFRNYRKYMEENIRYPEELSTQKEVVVLKFTVTRAGSIDDVIALRTPGVSYTEEAIRLLMDGPAWNPASNEQGTRDESVRMRIVFKR